MNETQTAHCLSAEGPAKEGVNTHQKMNRVMVEVPGIDKTDVGGRVFALDKGYYEPMEIDRANCLEAREDRGLTKRGRTGTMICIGVEK